MSLSREHAGLVLLGLAEFGEPATGGQAARLDGLVLGRCDLEFALVDRVAGRDHVEDDGLERRARHLRDEREQFQVICAIHGHGDA